MKHLDLFTGIGGFALASGWVWPDREILSFVEINKFCQKVLSKNFPGVPIHGDIKTFSGGPFAGTVDLLTGGFPCQPYSVAGQRRGDADDRALWLEMLRVIEECRPRWVVAENVPGIASMVKSTRTLKVEGLSITRTEDEDRFEAIYTYEETMLFAEICKDLEGIGYEVQPLVIPACGLNAPHRRDRVWIIAHALEGRRPTGTERVRRQERSNLDRGAVRGQRWMLPTPQARSPGQSKQVIVTPSGMVRGVRKSGKLGSQDLEATINHLLPTPTVNGNYNRKGLTKNSGDGLATVLGLLPIPISRDWKDTGNMENVPENGILGRMLSKRHGRKLLPEFLEYMMGYPEGWTNIDENG